MTDKTGSDARRYGFFMIDNVVVDKYDLNPYQGWIYAIIVRHVNHKDKVAFPSISTLQKIAHMSRQKVVDTLKELEDKKLIKIEKQPATTKAGNIEYKPNHYEVCDLSDYAQPSLPDGLGGSLQDRLRVVTSPDEQAEPSLSGVSPLVYDVDSKYTESKNTGKYLPSEHEPPSPKAESLAPSAQSSQATEDDELEPAPKLPTHQQELFAVFREVHGMTPDTELPSNSRIGKYAKWLAGFAVPETRAKDAEMVAGCIPPASANEARAFLVEWMHKKKLSLPGLPSVFADTYYGWRATYSPATCPTNQIASEPIPTMADMKAKAKLIRELAAQGRQDEALKVRYADVRK